MKICCKNDRFCLESARSEVAIGVRGGRSGPGG